MTSSRKKSSSNSLFWGLLLILLGTFFMLNNYDIIHIEWENVWSLWPLALIFVGISKFSIKDYIKIVISFVFFLIALYLLFKFGGDNSSFIHFHI